eukprot:jgi/Mesvir1/13932/Mv16053-RA.1
MGSPESGCVPDPFCVSPANCADYHDCNTDTNVYMLNGCPDGWTYSAAGRACLRLSTTNSGFLDQDAQCLSLWPSAYPSDLGDGNPGHLVKIPSAGMNADVSAMCGDSNYCFIGLGRDAETPGTFVWRDGTEATYLIWDDVFPSDDLADIYGAIIGGANVGGGIGTWFLVPDTASYTGVCQINLCK